MKYLMILVCLCSSCFSQEFTYRFAETLPSVIKKQFESGVKSFARKNGYTARRVNTKEFAFVYITHSNFDNFDANLDLFVETDYMFRLDFNYYLYDNWKNESARAGWITIEALTRMLPTFLAIKKSTQ